MNFLAQTDEAIRLVDSASKQSDRWLFLAALVMLGLVLGLVVKWLVAHIERKDAAITEKDKWFEQKLDKKEEAAKVEREAAHTQFLATLAAKDVAFAQIAKELSALTEATEKNTKILVDHDNRMTTAHSVEMGVMIEAAIQKHEREMQKKVAASVV